VASRGFGQSYSRISAADLVRRVPIVPCVSAEAVRISVGICGFIACLLLSYIAARVTSVWLITLLLPASAWISACVIKSMNGAFLAEVVNQILRTLWLRSPVVYEASRERSTAASGVLARSLAFLDKDHKQLVSEYRAAHGRSAEAPEVPYRLVVASYQLNGNERVVALSDGTHATWYRTSRVLVEHMDDSWWRADRDEEGGAAAALGELIRVLYEEDDDKGIRGIHARLKEHRTADIDRALDAAQWWRLIREDVHLAVHLTEAGRHWHLATASGEAMRAAERQKMSNNSGGGPQFNIGGDVSGGIYVAGQNIFGNHSHDVQGSPPSDDQVISCLQEILGSTDIPWLAPELAGVREVMESAVVQRDPRASDLKQAIAKLKEVCEQVAMGILGNGAYQLLIQYFL
jgi:hypothetical protein